MERSGVLPSTQFRYWKRLGSCDAVLCVSRTLKHPQDAMIVQIDLKADFKRANHQGILYKLCYVANSGSVVSLLSSFYQIDHSMLWFTVVGVNLLTLCQKCQSAVFWTLLYTSELFFQTGKSLSVMSMTPL